MYRRNHKLAGLLILPCLAFLPSSAEPASTPPPPALTHPQGNSPAIKAYLRGRDLALEDSPDALKYLNEAIRLDPKCTAAYYGRGNFYMHRENFPLAIKDLDKVALKFKDFHGVFLDRAYCHARLSDWPLALRDYTKVTELYPAFYSAYEERAKVYRHMGRSDLARKDLETAVRIQKQGPSAPDFRFVNSMIKKDQNSRGLFLERGLRYRDARKYREAIADLTKVLSIEPDKGGRRVNYNLDQIYYDRAGCYEKLGEYTQAIADYTSVLKLDEDAEEAFLFRGNCKAQLGQWEKALEDYNKCIKLNVDPTKTPYLARARAYEKLGKMDLARKDYQRAKELDR